jgi:hypothetical protein
MLYEVILSQRSIYQGTAFIDSLEWANYMEKKLRECFPLSPGRIYGEEWRKECGGDGFILIGV